MNTIPLGQLLKQSYSFCVTHWKAIIAAAVVAGALSALATGMLAVKGVDMGARMAEQMGMDTQKMQELSLRMQEGDESAMAEMEALVQGTFGDLDEEGAQKAMSNVMLANIGMILPYIGLAAVISFILTVGVSAYYLLLALGKATDPMKLTKMSLPFFFPLLGVWVWTFLRSFAWIPFIGIIPAIILGPRFALSSVILVQEKKGVMQSVSESYSRTAGYWGKIVGNIIVMALCVILVSIVLGMFISLVSTMFLPVGLWLKSVLQYVYVAFGTVFMTQLALTIMAHPMKASATPVKSAASKPVVTKKAAPKKTAAKKKK